MFTGGTGFGGSFLECRFICYTIGICVCDLFIFLPENAWVNPNEIPFGLVGECTTHFRTYFSGD